MYTKDFSELIYFSNTQEDFIFNLKIHHSIFSSSIKEGSVYLDKYIFTDEPVQGSKDSQYTREEVLSLLNKDRLEVKAGRKIIITSVASSPKNEVKSFKSIKDCLVFLNTIAPSNKTTLYRHIESGKPYQGFLCEWENEESVSFSDKSIRISVIDTLSGKSTTYDTIRKAALSFSPHIKTTGQTIKSYAVSGKLFKDKYKIEFYKDKI